MRSSYINLTIIYDYITIIYESYITIIYVLGASKKYINLTIIYDYITIIYEERFIN